MSIANKTVTLDLNGHIIDRGLKMQTPKADGSVFTVDGGNLTVRNSGSRGSITGGNITGNGGGVIVKNGGTFTLEGGAISGNRATSGGGVYVSGVNTGAVTAFELSGNAVISDNTATRYGGGVYVSDLNNSFKLSGAPKVTANRCGDAASDVHLARRHVVTVTGALADGARIGVITAQAPAAGAPVALTVGTAYMEMDASQFVNINKNFANVTFEVEPGKQTILPARITIQANDHTSSYGEPLEKLDWTVSGNYVEGDDLGISAVTAADTPGEYPIALRWNDNPNYNAVLISGKYTVTNVDFNLVASGYSGVYDGKEHGITVTADNAKVYFATTPLDAGNYAQGSLESPTRKEPGTLTAGDNYEMTFTGAALTISAKPEPQPQP